MPEGGRRYFSMRVQAWGNRGTWQTEFLDLGLGRGIVETHRGCTLGKMCPTRRGAATRSSQILKTPDVSPLNPATVLSQRTSFVSHLVPHDVRSSVALQYLARNYPSHPYPLCHRRTSYQHDGRFRDIPVCSQENALHSNHEAQVCRRR